MMRQPVLRSKTLTIGVGEHWKIEAADRRVISVIVDDNSGGFDLAFTAPDTLPLADEWIDGVGANENGRRAFTIETGCGGEIHFKDNDNAGAETISVVSDVQAVFTQIS